MSILLKRITLALSLTLLSATAFSSNGPSVPQLLAGGYKVVAAGAPNWLILQKGNNIHICSLYEKGDYHSSRCSPIK